jgi:cytochrome c5
MDGALDRSATTSKTAKRRLRRLDGEMARYSEESSLAEIAAAANDDASNDRRAPDRVYELVCAGCHDTGANGAPRPGDSVRWAEISRQSREQIHRNVIEGSGEMPARGLCNICTDSHLRATADFMVEQGIANDQAEP